MFMEGREKKEHSFPLLLRKYIQLESIRVAENTAFLATLSGVSHRAASRRELPLTLSAATLNPRARENMPFLPRSLFPSAARPAVCLRARESCLFGPSGQVRMRNFRLRASRSSGILEIKDARFPQASSEKICTAEI